MEQAATKLLESATIKTLHAHNFSRSSHISINVLTDLLTRYLALLALSSAKYASQAGRTALTPRDALAALDDLGIAVDELAEYCLVEAKDLGRYASHSTRRLEDLYEFKSQLATGLRQDRDDATLLDFMPYYEDEDEDEMDVDSAASSPLLLSPVSASSSPEPSRSKRPRTASWNPPQHIPPFLPPFPTTEPLPPSPPEHPDSHSSTELMPPPPDPKQPIVPVTQAMTASSASASDYLVQVPYSQSSLSSVPEYHLPTLPLSRAHRKASTTLNPPATTTVLQTEPALFKAYHHVLTHRPPTTLPPSTISRHKVAMALLALTQNTPRWDAADSLFSTVAPCPPRVAVIGPSYPLPNNADPKDITKDKDFRLPPTIPRPVFTTERLTPLLGQQSNRIPELARHVLPPVVTNRITRLAHPPVLYRGNKPIVYGRGIPAPWNSHTAPTPDPPGTVPPTPTFEKDKESGGAGGGGPDLPTKSLIPDAKLFATWEFEPKDYKLPLPPPTITGSGVGPRHRTSSRVGSTLVSPSAGVISLPLNAGARSRSGSKHG